MHELSMMSSIVAQVEELAVKEKFEHVYEIKLTIGAMSGIDPSCLEFCFEEATSSSILKGAKLSIHGVEVELCCQVCRQLSSPKNFAELVCSECQSNNVSITHGREFNIKEIEVD